MPTISFPSNPSPNDTYSFGGKTWIYNGSAWDLQSSGAINDIPIGNVTPSTGAFTTLSATGNISGSYFLGNGSQLTGIQAGATVTVANTAPVSPAQGDVWIDSDTGTQLIYFTSGGNSQWAEMEADQSFSYVGGSDSDLTAVNTDILPIANVTYDIGNVTNRFRDIYLANSTIYLGEAQISATGNSIVLPANTTIGGNAVVVQTGNGSSNFSGNITAEYFIGNGSQLTGLPAGYADSNVVTLLGSFGSNTVSTTGNITAGYFIGNGSQLTGLPASYGNANVVTLLAAFGSNTISTTGNVTAGNLTTTGTMTAGSIVETSSIALKENIRPLAETNPLDTILQLAGQVYDRRDGSQKDETGLIAEDVFKIVPNLVGLDDQGNPASVRYSRLTVYLLEAIKSLKQEIDTLKNQR